MSSPPSSERPYAISALDSALSVLETIAAEPGMRLLNLVKRSGLSKSHVFRILKNLEHHALIWQDALGGHHLGQAAYLLGKRAERQWSLAHAARGAMDRLAVETQENVHLVVREYLGVVVVDLRESPHPVRMYAAVGRRGPLHAGGTSRVLLAHAGEAVLAQVLAAPLPRYTANTLTDADALRATLEEIRRSEVHVALCDLEEDTFSVAAPIFGHDAGVLAALSVAGPLSRFDAARDVRYREAVRRAAADISRNLGYLS